MKYKTRWENIVFIEKGSNHLLNKLAFAFKYISHNYLRLWCRTNTIIYELKGERRRKERKEKNERMREKEIEEREEGDVGKEKREEEGRGNKLAFHIQLIIVKSKIKTLTIDLSVN